MIEKKIEIFTIATGPYVAYLDNFLNTVGNFFPAYKKKINVFVDTDSYEEIKGLVRKFINTDIEINVDSILDLPFPLIPLQKTFIMNKYASKDLLYTFWFDIDTIFLRKNDEYWENFSKQLDKSIVVSIHPHYGNHMFNRQFLVEKNKQSEAYIPTRKFNGIMSSFWGGTPDEMSKLNKRVNQMFANDLKNIRYLPKFVDENYIDKVIWEESNKETPEINFSRNRILIAMPSWNKSYTTYNDPFIVQKYDIKIKELRKQAMDL